MEKILSHERNVRIGPIGEAILGILVAGTIVSTLAIFPGVTYIIAPFIKKKKYSPRQIISRNLDSLITSGLIERIRDTKGEPALRLTKKGVWEAMLRHHKFSTLPNEKRRWDKTWNVVIFDVPNEKNKRRRDLRRAMRMYGFKQLQKSAWVYPYECDAFITLLKAHLGVSHDVLSMKVSSIENDRHLRKEFCL